MQTLTQKHGPYFDETMRQTEWLFNPWQADLQHTDPIPERSAGLTERQACEALIRALTQAIDMWLRSAQKPADNSDDNSNHNDD